MQNTLEIRSLHELPMAARVIVEKLDTHPIVAFYGAMGAGKTTLIREICRQLGVGGEVTSPTFALVNRYEAADGRTIDHFDFYRLERPEEALDIGAEEYFDSGEVCLIEWPERLGELLPGEALRVHIEAIDERQRRVRIG